MTSRVRAQLGGIDALVLNAGICPWVPFFEITEEQWDRVIDVNLKGRLTTPLVREGFRPW